MTTPGPAASDAMAANRDNWNARVPGHVAPDGYDLDHLLGAPDAISHIVRFDQERLGSLHGVDAVHLQCHIGTDTISLGRLGANVSGLDFAEDAITEARSLAARCGVAARFEVGNVYEAAATLGATYDLVYTGVGALNWLPDIAAWAKVVAALLRPGGRLHLFEHHPVLFSLADDAHEENLRLGYPYFQTASPLGFEESSSYLGSGDIASPLHYEWNHGLGEVIQAVLDAGMTLTSVEEHEVLPWQGFEWFVDVPGMPGWSQLPETVRQVVPLSYTLQAAKPAAQS